MLNMHRKQCLGVAAFAALQGITLSFAVPRANKVYETLYPDWAQWTGFGMNAFRWPGYIWIVSFGALAGAIYFVGRFVPKRAVLWVNASFMLGLIIISILALDWLSAFIFCHSWGCSRMLGQLSPWGR